LSALTVAALASACGQTVRVHAPASSRVQINESAPVAVDDKGQGEVEIPIGFFDSTYAVSDGDGEVIEEGEVPRTQLELWLAVPLVASTACTVPPALGVGFCAANPTLLCGVCLTGLGPQGLVYALNNVATTLDRPSAATVPAMMGCALLGAAPLALLPLALRADDELSLAGAKVTPDDEPRAMLW
jgi:hypothetical protein